MVQVMIKVGSDQNVIPLSVPRHSLDCKYVAFLECFVQLHDSHRIVTHTGIRLQLGISKTEKYVALSD